MEQTKPFGYGTAAEMRSNLERTWAVWDRLVEVVPPDRWMRKYGPHWTFQDVPYHVAYFDRVMVADVIEAGASLPESERFELLSARRINEWNVAEFAKRPAGQTPQQSVSEMLNQRERIRRLIADLTDGDLPRPAFSHCFGVGFSTA